MTGRQWAVAARLADGSLRFWCEPGTRRGGQDEWSPRANQARRFATKADAASAAAGLQSSGSAIEYRVVPV